MFTWSPEWDRSGKVILGNLFTDSSIRSYLLCSGSTGQKGDGKNNGQAEYKGTDRVCAEGGLEQWTLEGFLSKSDDSQNSIFYVIPVLNGCPVWPYAHTGVEMGKHLPHRE